jgi:hypothetical protein
MGLDSIANFSVISYFRAFAQFLCVIFRLVFSIEWPQHSRIFDVQLKNWIRQVVVETARLQTYSTKFVKTTAHREFR